jgi:hypothetical protein
MEEKEG